MADLEPKSFKQDLLDKIEKNNFEHFKNAIDKHYEQHYFHDVLSEIYEEVSLKGTQLSIQIKSLIENRLIKIRLYKKSEKQKPDFSQALERLDFLCFLIDELHKHKQSPDGDFVFISRTIATNIHILKKQLDFTYSVLPWEEMEFCLVSFVSGRIGRDLTLISDLVLDREKILSYLKYFQSALRSEKPKLTRPKQKVRDRVRVRNSISTVYPQFDVLYTDYELLRDVYSLKRMQRYLRLLLSSEESGLRQLAVERTLQVIGENLKNTPESPNISPETEKRLLNAAPEHLARILTFLRNTLSHSTVLEKKFFLRENYDDVRDGLKNIYVEIARILYDKFGQIFGEKHTLKSDQLDEIVSKLKLTYPENILVYDKFHTFTYEKNAKLHMLCNEIKYLIDTSNYHFTDLRAAQKVNSDSEITVEHLIESYMSGSKEFEDEKRLSRIIKNVENKMFNLKKINGSNEELQSAKNARETIKRICLKIEDALQGEKKKQHFNKKLAGLEELHFARAKILGAKIISEYEYKETIKRFPDDVRKNLKELSPFFELDEIQAMVKVMNDVYETLLASGSVVSLKNYKSILNKLCEPLEFSDVIDHLVDDFKKQIDDLSQLFETSKISDEVSIEMLLLDLLEILVNTYNFIDDASYLESPAPLLVGKNLLNYLAHGNPLIDTFPFDYRRSLEIHSNFFKEKYLKFEEGVVYGQTTYFALKTATEIYRKRLAVVQNQSAMFEAARQGNMDSVKDCVAKGADRSACDVNGESGLKCAVKGNNHDLFRYFLPIGSVNIQALLETAMQNESWNIAKYLLETEKCAQTADKLLHVAVLNNKDAHIVAQLLKLGCKANAVVSGTTPLHLAALYDFHDTAKMLLNHDASISFEDNNGDQPLHSAARSGSWKCAEMFLEKGAKINAKNHEGYTALHLAALFGHAEFIDKLLQNDSDDRNIALFLAAMYGHENTVEVINTHWVQKRELANLELVV